MIKSNFAQRIALFIWLYKLVISVRDWFVVVQQELAVEQ